jgi:hypothetical protein
MTGSSGIASSLSVWRDLFTRGLRIFGEIEAIATLRPIKAEKLPAG